VKRYPGGGPAALRKCITCPAAPCLFSSAVARTQREGLHRQEGQPVSRQGQGTGHPVQDLTGPRTPTYTRRDRGGAHSAVSFTQPALKSTRAIGHSLHGFVKMSQNVPCVRSPCLALRVLPRARCSAGENAHNIPQYTPPHRVHVDARVRVLARHSGETSEKEARSIVRSPPVADGCAHTPLRLTRACLVQVGIDAPLGRSDFIWAARSPWASVDLSFNGVVSALTDFELAAER
jgi:hypothetical protein